MREWTEARAGGFDCVVDSSVGIKLCLKEPLSERADTLFSHLVDDPPAEFYVPDLFFVECANILWKYAHRFGYAFEAALRDVRDLTRLPFQIVSTAALAEEALGLAVDYEVTAFDAAYVALARRLELGLVTADERLVDCFAEADVDVWHLSGLQGSDAEARA